MKSISLAFGRGAVEVEVPDQALVLPPNPTTPLPDPERAVTDALLHPVAGPPLRDLVRAGQKVAIVISDITRPVPNQVLFPPLLAELQAGGIRDQDIVIVNGTGLHRVDTEEELRWMLGSAILDRYQVVQHDARHPETLTEVGRTDRGVPAALCSAYVEADLRIVTGFVEPHLFAGYSGGAKGVMPGVASAQLIMSNHGAAGISHPRARWCSTEGNPVFEEMREIAGLCPPQFLLNVTLDVDRGITGVFAGEMIAAHDAAIELARRQYTVPIPGLFDVVVASHTGYPADASLYQSVKGMSVAAEAVRAGGSIVLAAGCEEGIGGEEYVSFLTEGESPAALLAQIHALEHPRHDQWQIQCQALVQARAEVYLHSLLPEQDTRRSHLRYCADISQTVADLVREAQAQGRPGSVLVMPHGQLTVPVVA